jgi:hypothetical protein
LADRSSGYCGNRWVIGVQFEPYELFFVPMKGGMIEYIYRNCPETISREVDLKSDFANCLFRVWWTLVIFNHPKELYGKNIELPENGLALLDLFLYDRPACRIYALQKRDRKCGDPSSF